MRIEQVRKNQPVNVSKAQFCVWLDQALEEAGYVFPIDASAAAPFADAEEIPDEAVEAICYLRECGILPGNPDGKLYPAEILSDAQAEEIINRAVKKMTEADSGNGIVLGAYDLWEGGSGNLSLLINEAKLDVTEEYPVIRCNDPRKECDSVWPEYDKGTMGYCPELLGINPRMFHIQPNLYPVMKICYRGGSFAGEALTGIAQTKRYKLEFTASDGEAEYINGREYRTSYIRLQSDTPLLKRTDDDIQFMFRAFDMDRDMAADMELVYWGFFKDEQTACAFCADSVKKSLCTPKKYESSLDFAVMKNLDETDQIEKEAQNRVQEILDTPSTITPEMIRKRGGTCYFISSLRGADTNDGLSENTPLRSLHPLVTLLPDWTRKHVPKPGDGVFFERGSVFYADFPTRLGGDTALYMTEGVSYGAYGEGPKPEFCNIVQTEDGLGNWQPTQWENLYVLDIPRNRPDLPVNHCYDDVGAIVFDDGKVWGGQRLASSYKDYIRSSDFGEDVVLNKDTVSNGLRYYKAPECKLTDPGVLTTDLEFFHDWVNHKLYLCSTEGSPRTRFRQIKVVKRGILVRFEGEHIHMDNLAIRYTGGHGMQMGDMADISITNCVFEWCGGSVQDGDIRYGECIENYGGCDGLKVLNCYFNQSYDGAFSTQCGERKVRTVMANVEVKDCVMYNSGCYIEIWQYPGPYDKNGYSISLLKNYDISNNYFISDGYVRHSQRGTFLTGVCGEYENVICENNKMIFMNGGTYTRVITALEPLWNRVTKRGILMRRNCYYLEEEVSGFAYCYGDLTDHSFSRNKRWRIRIPYTERMLRYIDRLGMAQECVFRIIPYAITRNGKEAK